MPGSELNAQCTFIPYFCQSIIKKCGANPKQEQETVTVIIIHQQIDTRVKNTSKNGLYATNRDERREKIKLKYAVTKQLKFKE